jgi:hypothetical protein
MQRFSRPQAYLCIQIGNVQSCVNLEWAELIHPLDFYLLDVKFAQKPGNVVRHASAVLVSRLLKLTDVRMTLQHKHVQLSVDMALKRKVSRHLARRIKKITRADYFMAAVMKDGDRVITSCCQLRPYSPVESVDEGTDSFARSPVFVPLYPKIDYQ